MRLYSYLNEEDIEEVLSLLKKDCMPIINELKQCKNRSLVRGYHSPGKEIFTNSMIKKQRRKDRKPMNMNKNFSDFYDEGFYNVFKWKPRKTGVFAIFRDRPIAFKSYGTPFLFFPIGKFRFIYSNTIDDLYFVRYDNPFYQYGENVFRVRDTWEELKSSLYKKTKDVKEIRDIWIKDKYTNSNLCESIDSHEIMFDCNEYYLINLRFNDTIKEKLLK